MEDAHRGADFEVMSRYGKSMMPVSVIEVDYASRSIARSENLRMKQTLSIVPQSGSKERS